MLLSRSRLPLINMFTMWWMKDDGHAVFSSFSSDIAMSIWTLAAVVTAIYLVSSVRGAQAVPDEGDGSQPPLLPYALPLLGHLPEFLWNTEKFLQRAV